MITRQEYVSMHPEDLKTRKRDLEEKCSSLYDFAKGYLRGYLYNSSIEDRPKLVASVDPIFIAMDNLKASFSSIESPHQFCYAESQLKDLYKDLIRTISGEDIIF